MIQLQDVPEGYTYRFVGKNKGRVQLFYTDSKEVARERNDNLMKN